MMFDNPMTLKMLIINSLACAILLVNLIMK